MMLYICLICVLFTIAEAFKTFGVRNSLFSNQIKNPTNLFAKKKTTTAEGDIVQGDSLSKDARLEVLSGVLTQIERCYGKGSIQKLGENPTMNVAMSPSGSLTLDLALGDDDDDLDFTIKNKSNVTDKTSATV
jgi:hypothetical protein